MISFKTGTGATLARTGLSAALALAAVSGLATTSQAAGTVSTIPVITPSSANGPSGGGNVLTLTLPSTATKKFTSGLVGIQFQNVASASTPCSAAPAVANTAGVAEAVTSNTTPTNLRFLSTTKVIVTVPSLASGINGGTWAICAYSDKAGASDIIPSTATLVAKGVYNVATQPTVTNTAGSGIVPASGPALGGQTVTINGTGFPTTISAATPLTATLGGIPMTNITPVSTLAFTAVTPAHAAGNAQVVVTTIGGSTAASLGTAYAYANGIVISPTSTTTGTPVDLDIQGVGFSSLAFTNTAGITAGQFDGTSHVFLSKGLYSNAGFTNTSANKAVGQSAECINVLVLSDTELICTVDPTKSVANLSAGNYTWAVTALATGTYTVSVVSNADAAAITYESVISSGSTFTVAPF